MAEINNEKIIKIPGKCEELAELVGIILGDGCIGVYNNKRKWGTYVIRIVGDSRYDKDYLVNYVKPLADDLFGINSKIYFSKISNSVRLDLCGKKIASFLLYIGLKEGNKIKNQVRFPNWVWKRKKYVKSCLRGLIDTDGSIYELLPHWPGLFQLSLYNKSLPLLKDAKKAFLILGFTPSVVHIHKNTKVGKLCITRKADIHKFYKEICFHNKRHLDRYSPVV